MFLLCYLSPTIMHVRIRDTSDYALNVFHYVHDARDLLNVRGIVTYK